MPLGAFKAALMGTAGVSAGASVVLLSTQTATSDASISFTSGITSTYGEYIFGFYNINPATDLANFSFQVNATDDDGGDYDQSPITSTDFSAIITEGDESASLGYQTPGDQAEGTAFQILWEEGGNGGDESGAGVLHLFNPSSTTYVKHFYARTQSAMGDASGDYSTDTFVGGYINQTDDVDAVIFNFQTGVFDGKFKMWGVK